LKGEGIVIKLIGVVIILVGLVLKLDTLGVVLVEGLSTGLESGLGIGEILSIIGGSFYFYTIYVNFLINIISGKCRQVLYGTNGKKVSYFRLTPGTFFGEMDYLDQNRTCVKTECLTDVKLSVIYHETLEK